MRNGLSANCVWPKQMHGKRHGKAWRIIIHANCWTKCIRFCLQNIDKTHSSAQFSHVYLANVAINWIKELNKERKRRTTFVELAFGVCMFARNANWLNVWQNKRNKNEYSNKTIIGFSILYIMHLTGEMQIKYRRKMSKSRNSMRCTSNLYETRVNACSFRRMISWRMIIG